jgi:ABC-2 type transport system ATP-binding protein
MIRLDRLTKSYGPHRVVDEVSFNVPAGSITILAGADAAGKSTLLKMIVGLVKKDGGRVLLRGQDVSDDLARVTAVTGYMPERFSLYTDLSVEENLNFFAEIHEVSRTRREALKTKLLEKTGMLAFRKRRAGALSGGMKQKLALSAILLASPEFILLDEPTTGVDPLSRIEFFNLIQELRAEGRTVLMATPYLAEAEKGDFVVFLRQGRVLKSDSINSLKKSFPARVFRLEPRLPVFEALKNLPAEEGLRQNVYIQGGTLRCLEPPGRDFRRLIPHTKAEEERPTLEDIYIYYERSAERPA